MGKFPRLKVKRPTIAEGGDRPPDPYAREEEVLQRLALRIQGHKAKGNEGEVLKLERLYVVNKAALTRLRDRRMHGKLRSSS